MLPRSAQRHAIPAQRFPVCGLVPPSKSVGCSGYVRAPSSIDGPLLLLLPLGPSAPHRFTILANKRQIRCQIPQWASPRPARSGSTILRYIYGKITHNKSLTGAVTRSHAATPAAVRTAHHSMPRTIASYLLPAAPETPIPAPRRCLPPCPSPRRSPASPPGHSLPQRAVVIRHSRRRHATRSPVPLWHRISCRPHAARRHNSTLHSLPLPPFIRSHPIASLNFPPFPPDALVEHSRDFPNCTRIRRIIPCTKACMNKSMKYAGKYLTASQ
jgi:hypothetical protein